MIRPVDEEFLRRAGLEALPDDYRAAFLAHLQETLELRVGQRLGADLTDAQLSEYLQLVKGESADLRTYLMTADPRSVPVADVDVEDLRNLARWAWLAANSPDYREVAIVECWQLEREVSDAAAAILKDARGG